MRQDDLIELWLQGKSRKPLFKTNQDYRAYYASPEAINSVVNHFDTMDLFLRPDATPFAADYETSAVNLSKDKYGPPYPFALFADGAPKSNLNLIRPDPNTDPAGVYWHEFGHFMDERLDHEKGAPYPFKTDKRYKGYVNDLAESMMKDLKMPRRKALRFARREAPAQIAEDAYRESK